MAIRIRRFVRPALRHKSLSFRLPIYLARQLQRRARIESVRAQKSVSQSAVVRMALEWYFAKNPLEPQEE